MMACFHPYAAIRAGAHHCERGPLDGNSVDESPIDRNTVESTAEIAAQERVVVERQRTVGTKISNERRYYISSLHADAARIAHALRSHWEVENRLHWCLDVQFNEDQSTTVRTG